MQQIKQEIAKIDGEVLKGKGIIENVTKEVQQLISNKQELIGYAKALQEIINDGVKEKKEINKPAKEKISKKK